MKSNWWKTTTGGYYLLDLVTSVKIATDGVITVNLSNGGSMFLEKEAESFMKAFKKYIGEEDE